MTDLRKSDSQLDAEAQAIEDRDLELAIAQHRVAFKCDHSWLMRLHVRDGESGIGPPFSPAFEALLDDSFGRFPYSKAMVSLRERYCRESHAPKHTDRSEWRGSLCHTLVGMVIRLEFPIAEAQCQLGLPNEGKTRRTLDNALLYIERRLEDEYQRQKQDQRSTVQRTPAEWMSVEHRQRHDQPGMHRVDCRQCLRAAVAA